MRLIQSTFVVSVLSAALFLLVTGCSEQKTAEQPKKTEPGPVANKICPIMGGKVTAEGGTVQWDGKTVGFCCPECIPNWNDLSAEEKQKKWDEAKAKADDNTSKDS